MVGGIFVPLALSLLPATRRVRWLVLGALLAVVGMWLKRLLITLPSATAPLIGDSWGSPQFTWVAIAITIGATAAIPLGLMVVFRIVPILSLDEMAEAEPAAPSSAGSRDRLGGGP
jgi:Ni/Fe-hydrogenase subunit HybB-like protein